MQSTDVIKRMDRVIQEQLIENLFPWKGQQVLVNVLSSMWLFHFALHALDT